MEVHCCENSNQIPIFFGKEFFECSHNAETPQMGPLFSHNALFQLKIEFKLVTNYENCSKCISSVALRNRNYNLRFLSKAPTKNTTINQKFDQKLITKEVYVIRLRKGVFLWVSDVSSEK